MRNFWLPSVAVRETGPGQARPARRKVRIPGRHTGGRCTYPEWLVAHVRHLLRKQTPPEVSLALAVPHPWVVQINQGVIRVHVEPAPADPAVLSAWLASRPR